jgi:hypothetical protein
MSLSHLSCVRRTFFVLPVEYTLGILQKTYCGRLRRLSEYIRKRCNTRTFWYALKVVWSLRVAFDISIHFDPTVQLRFQDIHLDSHFSIVYRNKLTLTLLRNKITLTPLSRTDLQMALKSSNESSNRFTRPSSTNDWSKALIGARKMRVSTWEK